jgi:hypothetical protein
VDDHFHEASYPILAARRKKSLEGPDVATPHWIGMADLADVFNDIFLGEFLYIVKQLTIGLRKVRAQPELTEAAFAEAKVNTYDFGICVGSGLSHDTRATISKFWEKEIKSGAMRYGPMIVMDIQTGILEIFLDQRSGISQTEQCLGTWISR